MLSGCASGCSGASIAMRVASPRAGHICSLSSRLNCPTSVAQAGSAIAASTSALRMEGMPRSSTRFSSISWPTVDGFSSNSRSRGIRAKTSSDLRPLSRYLRRSSPLILMAWMSRPIEVSAQRVNRAYAPPAGSLTHSHAAGPGASDDSGGRQPGGLVPDPQAEEPAQVRDELVVLVRRVNRLDRLDQQLVEGRAGHPVQHDVVELCLLARPEVLIAPGVEVGIGEGAVRAQLFPGSDPPPPPAIEKSRSVSMSSLPRRSVSSTNMHHLTSAFIAQGK